MKKITKKTSEPTAPIKAAVKAPAKKTVSQVKKPVSPAKARNLVSSEPPATFISAKIDIGFGNHLYIRGEAPGLSWDHGTAMDCVGSDLWTITINHATAPVLFKLLVNDLTWSAGEDFVAQPGQSFTFTPSF
jgi:hypothetical protein